MIVSQARFWRMRCLNDYLQASLVLQKQARYFGKVSLKGAPESVGWGHVWWNQLPTVCHLRRGGRGIYCLSRLFALIGYVPPEKQDKTQGKWSGARSRSMPPPGLTFW